MSLSFGGEYPQDTISFSLTEESTVSSDTVKISVPVNAIVQNGQSEDELRVTIKDTLKKFIKADWNFGATQRHEIQIGIERCTVTATCRVNERENYSLKERARQVSIPGHIELGDPSPDYSMPNHKLQEAEQELRVRLLKKAKDHAAALSEVVGIDYRLAEISFGGQSYDTSNRAGSTRPAAYGATMSLAASYEEAGESGDIAHSAKIVMTASVHLAHAFLEED
jgi:hypothetical protein